MCHLTLISPTNVLCYLHEHRCVDMSICISLIHQQSHNRVFVPSAQRGYNLDDEGFCCVCILSFPTGRSAVRFTLERGTLKPHLGSCSGTLQQDRCLPSSNTSSFSLYHCAALRKMYKSKNSHIWVDFPHLRGRKIKKKIPQEVLIIGTQVF